MSKTLNEQPLNVKQTLPLTIVFNSDQGVDDVIAQFLMLAYNDAHNINIAGMVPTVGDVVLEQAETNMFRVLESADHRAIKVYPGSLTPLGLEKNVSEVNAGIKAVHFYGYDGLEDVGGWPNTNKSLQKQAGHEFMAELILNASPDKPVTIVSTAALTEIYKTLTKLIDTCKQKGLEAGCFSKNIKLVMMGGVINQVSGPNAPFGWPDYNPLTCKATDKPCKDAEANFYWDTPATKGVFDICEKYGIKPELITLDLTQLSGLLWTDNEVNTLKSFNNYIANQMAKVTGIVPYLDAPCFPQGTFPWHDGLTSAYLLWPSLFTRNPMNIQIGDHGQTIVNNGAEANAYVIGITQDNIQTVMERTAQAFKNFDGVNPDDQSSGATTITPPFFNEYSTVKTLFEDFFYG
jgi:inosine-uridine nucleoside N-ribohydrolase